MTPQSTDEKTQAIALANRLLDEPMADPDDDLRVLSRQLLRRHEENVELARLLRYAAKHSSLAPLMNDSWREDSLAALGERS